MDGRMFLIPASAGAGFLDRVFDCAGDLLDLLNPERFSADSLEGTVVLFLTLYMAYLISAKMFRFAGWVLGMVFLIQTGYCLSFTALNDWVPLSRVFRYDILTAVAQLFVGTKVSEWLVGLSAWMRVTFEGAGNLSARWIGTLAGNLEGLF